MTGGGDFPQLVTSFARNATEEVLKITTPAFQKLENAITTDAQAFMNDTSFFEDKVEEIAGDVYNTTLEIFQINTTAVQVVIKEGFDKVEDLVKTEMRKLQNVTTNLEGKVENVTDTAFQDFKTILDDILAIPGFSEFRSKIDNITDTAIAFVKSHLKDAVNELEDSFHVDQYAFPTVDLDFNIPQLPSIPEVSMRFELDALDLYLEIDTVLSIGATYTLPLYISETPIGASLGDVADGGVIVEIFLVIDVHAQIDISSGFHLKVDDPIIIDIEMFSQNVSKITL